jgi:hypothetical protein
MLILLGVGCHLPMVASMSICWQNKSAPYATIPLKNPGNEEGVFETLAKSPP